MASIDGNQDIHILGLLTESAKSESATLPESESKLCNQNSSRDCSLFVHKGLLSEGAAEDLRCGRVHSAENPKPDIPNAEGVTDVDDHEFIEDDDWQRFEDHDEEYDFQLRDNQAFRREIVPFSSSSSSSSSSCTSSSDEDQNEKEDFDQNWQSSEDDDEEYEFQLRDFEAAYRKIAPSSSSSSSPSSPSSSSSSSDENQNEEEVYNFPLPAFRNILSRSPWGTDVEATPPNLKDPLSPYEGWCLKSFLWRESEVPSGGFFAHRGFNKARVLSSLILHHKHNNDPTFPSEQFFTSGKLIEMIKSECLDNSLTFECFHGPGRADQDLLYSDVVVTTYAVVEEERAGVDQSKLFRANFDRVILDDAECLVFPTSDSASIFEAVCRLRGVRRWAISYAPIRNKDFPDFLSFLKITPFENPEMHNCLLLDDDVWQRLHDTLLIRYGPIRTDNLDFGYPFIPSP